jgi:Polyketide cyclase / dehydrase and lipid transport
MLEVYRSSMIPAPAARVWALLRDFNAMPEWNATIRRSFIENGPAHRIGCRRILTFDDGSVWTHELTGLSDAEMSIAYAIVGMPLVTPTPVRDYRAVIRVEPPTEPDRCVVTWRATLETDWEEAVRERAGAVFEAGFDGLKRRLGV